MLTHVRIGRDGGDEGVGRRRTSVDLGSYLAHHVHVMRQQGRMFGSPGSAAKSGQKVLSLVHFSSSSFAALISAALRTTTGVFIQARRAALAASISAWLVTVPSDALVGAGGGVAQAAPVPIAR